MELLKVLLAELAGLLRSLEVWSGCLVWMAQRKENN